MLHHAMRDVSPSPSPGDAVGPAVAGLWYAEAPAALRADVARLLEAASRRQRRAGTSRAIIVPHAGYSYSGPVAAAGFSALDLSSLRRIVLLGPSHYASFAGACAPAANACRTPLGDVPLDLPQLECLQNRVTLRRDDRPFLREHSLEAQLPFLQLTLPREMRVLPLLLGSVNDADRALLAAALAPLADDPRTAFVASSDFTHFGPRFGYEPFRTEVPERLRRLDGGAIELIAARDGSGFRRYVRRTGATICGRAAIELLLDLLPPESRGELVEYDTSGRIGGDWEHSVSYASLRFDAPEAVT